MRLRVRDCPMRTATQTLGCREAVEGGRTGLARPPVLPDRNVCPLVCGRYVIYGRGDRITRLMLQHDPLSGGDGNPTLSVSTGSTWRRQIEGQRQKNYRRVIHFCPLFRYSRTVDPNECQHQEKTTCKQASFNRLTSHVRARLPAQASEAHENPSGIVPARSRYATIWHILINPH